MFYVKFIDGVFFISETSTRDETNRQKIGAKSDFIVRYYNTGFCRVLKDNTGHFMAGNFTKSGALSIKEVMDYVKIYYYEK